MNDQVFEWQGNSGSVHRQSSLGRGAVGRPVHIALVRLLSLIVLCGSVLVELPTRAEAQQTDEEPCPHEFGWKPENLESILDAHDAWLVAEGYYKVFHDEVAPAAELARANLCNSDLRFVDLQGADLGKANLQGADLEFAELQEATLRGATLQGAQLSEATLQGADLSEANLLGAELYKANLQGADLSDANLQGADLSEANLQGADLSDANLQGAELRWAELQGADLRSADLQEADLVDANLQGADLGKANLQGADLAIANLREARLRGANLQGVDLVEANLQGADLSEATLQGAALGKANLQEADLSDADMAKAYLVGANLQGADLRRANLQEANLRSANFQQADLLGANLQEADLSEANLQGADLSNANLQMADLKFANLQDAKLLGANITKSRFSAFGAPNRSHVDLIRGLSDVVFDGDHVSGFVQLRKALQDAGLRESEREATFALERHKTAELSRFGFFGRVEAAIRTALFDWTTKYGLEPRRPLGLIMIVIIAGAIFYIFPLSDYGLRDRKSGVLRVKAPEIVDTSIQTIPKEETERTEWLALRGLPVIGYAVYFSLLSAFNFSWADQNAGAWLTKLQPTEFALRGRGWVRVLSGLQCYLTVYLILISVLTTFARPFQDGAQSLSVLGFGAGG